MAQISNNTSDLHEDIARFLEQFNNTHNEVTCELKKTLTRTSQGCPVDFDTVLCWPQTPANSHAIQPCFDQLNGIKYDIKGEFNDNTGIANREKKC